MVEPEGHAPVIDRRDPQPLPTLRGVVGGLAGDRRPGRVREDGQLPRAFRPQPGQGRVFGQDGFDLLEQVKRLVILLRLDVRLDRGDLVVGPIDQARRFGDGFRFRPARASFRSRSSLLAARPNWTAATVALAATAISRAATATVRPATTGLRRHHRIARSATDARRAWIGRSSRYRCRSSASSPAVG